jgi:hypothetical protein
VLTKKKQSKEDKSKRLERRTEVCKKRKINGERVESTEFIGKQGR